MKLFLASEGFISIRENGVTIKREIDTANLFFDNLKKFIKKYDNFVFIPNNFDFDDINENSALGIAEAFVDKLSKFKSIVVLDKRNIKEAKSILENADFIFLQGGKLDEQYRFLKKVNFANIISKTNTVVVGKSAGAMNMCKACYNYPEEGDVSACSKKWTKGLGFVDKIIIPHFNTQNGNQYCPSNMNLLTDIFIPDSFEKEFYALTNGSYILVEEGKETLFGECYLIKNGIIKKICENNQSKVLKGPKQEKINKF